MSMIPESSIVTLYAGVDITSGLQIVFNSIESQAKYFASKKKFGDIMSKKKFSYLRRGGKLKLEMPTSDVAQCDYMSFRNPSFENKEFYAKIVNYQYINNRTTEITYAIDDFQTYMFDVNYEFGLIEREHLSLEDKERASVNPYDQRIFEFQTSEILPVSKEYEVFYDYDTGKSEKSQMWNTPSLISYGFTADYTRCLVLQISEFDTEELEDIKTNFYSLFDYIIKPDGTDLLHPNEPGAKIVVGRGFSLYCITDFETSGHGGIMMDERANLAINYLTLHGVRNNVIGYFQCSIEMWLMYIRHTQFETDPYFYTLYTKVIKPSLSISPVKYNVQNEKLNLFPYQYFRVYNNEGDVKEYRFEFFANVILHGFDGAASFGYLPLFDNVPMCSLLPQSYKMSDLTKDSLTYRVYNTEERIDCVQFPQVGFNTDAYLTYIASMMSQYGASKTQNVDTAVREASYDAEMQIRSTLDRNMVPEAFGSASEAEIYANMLRLQRSAPEDLESAALITGKSAQAFMKTAGAMYGSMVGDLEEDYRNWRSGGNVVDGYFSPAKGAFVADNYHAGSQNGTMGLYLGDWYERNPGTFTFQRVSLRSSILKTYDDYFSGYGYTSGRLGKPRICNYIKGSTLESEIPSFAEYNGRKITYVKTNNMHVDHTIASVASNIESMFNTGCQFLKGEDLYE